MITETNKGRSNKLIRLHTAALLTTLILGICLALYLIENIPTMFPVFGALVLLVFFVVPLLVIVVVSMCSPSKGLGLSIGLTILYSSSPFAPVFIVMILLNLTVWWMRRNNQQVQSD